MWGLSGFVVDSRIVRGSMPWGKSCLTALPRELSVRNKHQRQPPHLSCFDLLLLIRSIESRSFVEMNPLRYNFFDFESISANLRRPAALVIFAIRSLSGGCQELELVIQLDRYRGERERRLLSDRVCCAARTDDVAERIDGIEALRLNQEAVDRSPVPLHNPVTLERVADAISRL